MLRRSNAVWFFRPQTEEEDRRAAVSLCFPKDESLGGAFAHAANNCATSDLTAKADLWVIAH
jgi:pyruvoyl-dependent arginine decarboxylase (PvlArgDC)